MRTVKAARIHEYGGPEVVRVEEMELPELQAGQLLIRVHAAGVNPIDWKIRGGYMKQSTTVPFTAGFDCSGIVGEVGRDVAGIQPGDEVYGQAGVLNGGSGSFAEFSIARAGTVAPKPRVLQHVEAGALPLAGVSALQALTEHLGLAAGEKILIHGGAGGIGSIAIQLARHLGAHVATTVSADDIDYVKSLGAADVVDYKARKFEEVITGMDAVFDTVGRDTYTRSYSVLKRGGRIVSMLEQPNEQLMKEFGVHAVGQFTKVNTDRLSRLATLVDQGAVKVHVDRTFPLQEAAAAMAYLEKNSPRGKVVLEIA